MLATQNPIEQEGTYPLPEAQLDRFLLEIDVSYPDLDAERAMLLATTGADERAAGQAMTAEELMRGAGADPPHAGRRNRGGRDPDAGARRPAGNRRRRRRAPARRLGPGPRAAQALMLACRARALLDGRLAPSMDDVVALARPVLRHRMALNFSARADGVVLAEVIDRLVEPAWLSAAPTSRRRAPGRGAWRPPAAAAGRGRAGRRDRRAGRARPAPGRPGRQLLAVPAVRVRRSDQPHRLAPIGQVGATADGWFVRETEWEAAQTVCLWRDGSASMRWRSRGADVREARARRAAAAGAGVAAAARRRAGAADRRRTRAAVAGALGLDRAALDGAGRLGATTMTACRRTMPLPRHARVVLFGDFLSPLERDPGDDRPPRRRSGDRPSAAGARSGGGALPYAGRVRFRGLEREGDTLIPRVESVRDAYRERLAAQQEGLAAICAAAGFGFAMHRTDHPPEAALLALYTALSRVTRPR